MTSNTESTESTESTRGTYCVVIEKRLAVSQCPLPDGSCIWKHRKTGRCTYSEAFASNDFTANEFAARVGLPVPDSEALAIIKNSLADKIRHELAD
jgi:hypothetical protein